MDQQLRQERAFSRLAIFLFILVMMIIATYLTLYFHEIDLFLDFSFIGLFTGVIVSLAILTTFRVALYSLLAWLFNLEALQQHHTFHWLLNNVVLCSIILPVSIVGFYGPTIIQSVFFTSRVLGNHNLLCHSYSANCLYQLNRLPSAISI